MKQIALALFIAFLFIGFEWMRSEQQINELQIQRDKLHQAVKTSDSINKITIQNNTFIMNRIKYYEKKISQNNQNHKSNEKNKK